MRLLRESSPMLLAAALALAFLGITTVYSAVFYSELPALQSAWQRQATFAVVALALAIGVILIPSKFLYAVAYPLYLVSLLTLVAVLVWGTGDDAARWLRLGPLRLQPSEFTKIAVIIAMARYLGDTGSELYHRPRVFIGAFLLAVLPMGLVARQPDLGTAITYGAPLFPLLFWGGMSSIVIFCVLSPLLAVVCSFEPLWEQLAPYVFAIFIVGSTGLIHLVLGRLWVTVSLFVLNLSSGLITVYLWDHLLRAYQKERIISFLDPESDRLGAGWNIIQSKIAIGSGGITGKGYLEGTQTRYEFLPASHTDFVFSVIGEELGFVGTIVVLALFLFIIIKALYIASVAKNRFLSLIAVGVSAMLAFHVFVNVGMATGILPVTGLPLPFISYGGSSLVASFLTIGLLLHVYVNRHEY